MRKLIGTLIVISLLALVLVCAINIEAAENPKNLVERGKYLATIMLCIDCHTPFLMGPQGPVMGPDGIPTQDMARQFSGHPAGIMPYPTWMPEDLKKRQALILMTLGAEAGPWGVVSPANLTPDKETGIGEWTEEAFIQAIRTGKHQGQPNGRNILPPMPWPAYKHATDEDLKAIWAFLRSIPPVKNKVLEPVPPKDQSLLSNISHIIADPSPALKVKKSAESALVKRGEYLSITMDCHVCHTPIVQTPEGLPLLDEKGMPQMDAKRLLSGYPEGLSYPTWTPADMGQRHAFAMIGSMLTVFSGPWGVSFTTNLTPDKETGIGEWTEAAFIQAIRTGKHQGQPNGRDILPPMPWTAYKEATDEDLKAIWAYLRSIPAVKNKIPEPVPPPPMSPMAPPTTGR